MDRQKPGSMGGTYAGNAVSCAAGIACAQVMKEEKVLDNVAARSVDLLAMLKGLTADEVTKGLIAEVRGLGLVRPFSSQSRGVVLIARYAQMIGIEFNNPSDPYTPAAPGKQTPANIASRVQAKCLEKDVLTLTTSVYQTIRFIPPLNISQEDMKKGCEVIEWAIREVAREG